MMRSAATPCLRYVVWLAPLAVALAACNSTSPTTQSFSVSTTTKVLTPAGSSSATSGGSLTLSAAQVVLRKIELAPVGTTCASETERDDAARTSSAVQEADDAAVEQGNQDASCEGLELGPLTVNLPLDASTKVILDALVPAGTYTGVKAQLDAVTVSGVFTDAAGMAHSFAFTSTGHAEVEIQFPTSITVGPTTSNVTVTVDVAGWFKDASGAVLDPADPANLGTINRNIRRSFRAFGDDDHDGVDDSHEGNHGG
jgi:hypothetical protein